MPNIASVLKAEIARLARKEVRAEVDGLKKTVARQKAEIAELKRRQQALEQELKRASRTSPKRATAERQPDGEPANFRFNAKGLASNRQRLGLSAADYGLLVGTTGQSVYAWEAGKSRPRQSHVAVMASLRGIGKREAAARLAELKAAKQMAP